ncbi:MAG: hypothetical protein WB660_23345 [Candidatus Sulfotelmatobacter sp.]
MNSVPKLTHEQAKKFVVDRTDYSGQKAEDLLESLRQEQQTTSKRDRKAS